MAERYALGYLFLSFSIGVACLGVTLALAKRHGDPLARAFLMFYSALSILVTSRLLHVVLGAMPNPPKPSTAFVFEYMESIVGVYSMMFLAPFFAHRVYGVQSSRRDKLLLTITLVAAVTQHLTEFVLGDAWDDRGDVAEDVLLVLFVAYTLWIAFSRRNAPGIDRSLAGRFLVLLSIGLPGILYDLFFSDGSVFRFYPLWYCAISVVVTWTLWKHRVAGARVVVSSEWGLSERETEVLHLVRRGLSNKEIGAQMHISPNTVKTHLRAVFDKVGVHSRFALISLGAAEDPDGSGRTES